MKTLSDGLLAVSTFLLFVATVALCVIAFFQWRTMQGHHEALTKMSEHLEKGLIETRKAADAATTNAEAGQRMAEATAAQFELTERPWVVPEVRQIHEFSFREGTFMVAGYIAIKNIGKSPATDVSVRVAVHTTGSAQTIAQVRDRLTEDLLDKPVGDGMYFLFPTVGESHGFSFSQIASAMPPKFTAAVIVAVTYRASYNTTRRTTSLVCFMTHTVNGSFGNGETVKFADIKFSAQQGYGVRAT